MVDWGLAKAVGRVDPSELASRRSCAAPPAAAAKTLARQHPGHAGLHEPRAGAGRARRGWARSRMSTAWARRSTACSPASHRSRARTWSRRLPRRAERRRFQPRRSLTPRRQGTRGGLPEGDGTEPEDRYPTPKALADDLERWMADEPVSAWREPISRRAPAVGAGGTGRRSARWAASAPVALAGTAGRSGRARPGPTAE